MRVRVSTLLALLSVPSSVLALDKQAAAHGKQSAAGEDDFALSGSLLAGVSLYNPSYAARPDNSGIALLRYAGHVDIDLIGHKLSIPIDVNFLTDRDRSGGLKLVPTEFDSIVGLTSTWEAAKGSIEMGIRYERDTPLDRGVYAQEYADLRVRYVYSINAFAPGLRRALAGGDIRGWVGQGTFLYNPTYAARPDNTDLALFRAMAHAEVSAFSDHVGLAVDTTWFTRRERNHFRPTELDLTLELIARVNPFELHLAYERDMPIDRSGLTQQFVFAYASYAFEWKPAKVPPPKP
jgi:hypothetical protein